MHRIMDNDPYESFTNKEMILRDHLAIDRTIMANERTLLAYIRTALALVIAGATALHFLDSYLWAVVGQALIVLSLIVIFFGLRRYFHVRSLVIKAKSK